MNGSAGNDALVLEARAKALARRTRDPAPDVAIDVVVFTLAGETCALELRHLRQVMPARELARLPGARPPLIALTGWRGELICVVDLAQMLGRHGAAPSAQRHLLAVGEGAPYALLVDDILALRSIQTSAITAAPSENAAVRGITDDALLVLDGGELIRSLKREAP